MHVKKSGRPRAIENDDRGVALPLVIGLGMVMILLITTGLTVAISGMQQANTERSTTSALDAAYAGVQDYVARVNVDPTYVKYGNALSTFSAGSSVTANSSNPAFGVGVGGTWATVPGSGNAAKFRYEVDNSTYSTSGAVRIRVTGLAGDRTKTLLANLRVRGFVDYSYFTDYEIQDPQITGVPQTCVKHAWEGRPSGCGEIRFGPSDVLSGDVHSNDTMIICGSNFTGNVTTANTGTPLYTTPAGCSPPTINITRATSLPLPSTNLSMKTDAGCLYTGPTRVTYNGDGTMTVVSPWTKFTKVTGSTGSNPAACGDPAALASAAGATVPQLNNDLLYVQTVPPGTSDPNSWSSSTTPSGLSCVGANGAVSGTGDGIGWIFSPGGSKTAAVRYPLTNESPATGWASSSDSTQWNTTPSAYGCRNGDLFVKGTVTTLTTAASENYVYVIGDITYNDQNANILGLVGQNAVLVWNPVDSNGSSILTDTGRSISAAIVSVAHTFQVQNFDRGSARGALNLFGSIAQKFRGPVGALNPSSGYTKSYAYDPLLKTVSPPKFLAPSATSFTVTRYASVPIAFDSTGAQKS